MSVVCGGHGEPRPNLAVAGVSSIMRKGKVPSKSAKSDDSRHGTQTIERAAALLREISTRGQFGWQMSELAARCHLGKSTAHRILACLVRERLVQQRLRDRHYVPGPMLFELGLSLPRLSDLQFAARPYLEALAKNTGSAAFLLFRSGDDFVCAVRVGPDDLRPLTIFRGSRRPLITSVAGAAILLEMPPSESRAIIRRNFAALRESGVGVERIRASRALLKRTYTEQFAVNEGYLIPGFNAYGLALPHGAGEPFASISIAGPASSLPIKRLPEIRKMLESVLNELKEETVLAFPEEHSAAESSPTGSPRAQTANKERQNNAGQQVATSDHGG